MSEVSELIPPPAGGAGDGVDGVDGVGTSGAPDVSGGAAAPPQIRPILPTLPPRPSKTATASSNPGPAAGSDAGAPAAAAQTSVEAPDAPATEPPAAAPKLLTAPPLVAPPLVAPPTGAPVLAAPTVPTAPNTPGAALPPPSTAPAVADLPAPVPPSGAGFAALPVEGAAVPSLPSLGLSPATPGLSAMRLNLEPIEDVAARAAANAEHEHQAELAAQAASVEHPESAGNAEPDTPASVFTNGSALSMLSSAPGTAPDAPTTTGSPTGSTGPAVPTLASNRPASTTAVEGDLDEAAIEASVEDALAAAAAKSGDPHLLAAAAHFAAQKQAAALPPVKMRGAKRPKRRRGRYVLLALVLVAGSGAAYVFRDSPIMQKARGVGYDPQALPGTVYERPVPGTVEVSFAVASVEQLPSGDDVSIRTITDLTMNPTTGDGQYDGTQTVHPIVDGEPERDAVSTSTSELVQTATGRYQRASTGENAGVWTTPADPLGNAVGNVVLMYQDIVDESLRRVRPVSTETTVDGANTLTTYTWAIPVGEFYESAPQLSGVTDMLDGNADPASTVTVVMTVDAAGVVRLLDVVLELDAVLAHTADRRANGRDIPYHYRWELTSMSDEAFVAAVPEGASPIPDPSLDPAVVDPAATEPVAGAPAADPAADPAAAVPAPVDPAAVPETVPVTAPPAPAGG